MRAVAEVAGVRVLDDQLDEHVSAEVMRPIPRPGLIHVHEWGLDLERRIHAERERLAQRLQGFVAAVGVARIVGLAHAADQGADAAAIGQRRGVGKEQQVASRHERIRQAGPAHLDGDIARQARFADAPERGQLEHMVVAEARAPPRKGDPEPPQQLLPRRHLDVVPLAIGKPHRFDAAVALERRREANGRILTA